MDKTEIEAKYDDPTDPDLRAKLFADGKVVFLLSKVEATKLKKLTQTEAKLEIVTRRPEWTYRVYKWYLISIGIVKSIILSFSSPKIMAAFGFYAVNKDDLRNISEKTTSDGQVILTFNKKKSK